MAGVSVGQQPRHGDVTFCLANGLTVSVSSRDITQLSGGAAVAGEDAMFSGGGGVAKALLGAGGRGYKKARKGMIDTVRAQKLLGSVHSCSAGPRLGFRHVFHAVVRGHGSGLPVLVHLKNVYLRVVLLAEENNVASVVTPLLGTGLANLASVEDALRAAVDGLSQVQPGALRTVIIVDSRRGRADVIEGKLRQIPGVSVRVRHVDDRGPEGGPPHPGNPGPSGSGAGSRRGPPPGGFRQGPMHGGPSRGPSTPSAAGQGAPQPPRPPPPVAAAAAAAGMDIPAGDPACPGRVAELENQRATVCEDPTDGGSEDSDSDPPLPQPEGEVGSHQEDQGRQDGGGERETSPSLESEEESDEGASGWRRSEDLEESDSSTDQSQKVVMWSSSSLPK